MNQPTDRDKALADVERRMADKAAEMQADHDKALAAMQDQIDEQAVELGELEDQLEDEAESRQEKGDPKQADIYRQRVLTDLLKSGHFPATDHPALHDPDLTAEEWDGTAAERKTLGPKLKALHAHLKANPTPKGHNVVTAVSAQRLR